MKVTLAYGRESLAINLPAYSQVVRSRFVPGVADEPAAIRQALRKPIQSPPLAGKKFDRATAS